MNDKPLLIGITGGIGAGKTIITKIFNSLGIPDYNADNRAKYLMGHDPGLQSEIRLNFGETAFTPEGTLNTVYLSEKVFNNRGNLKKLNGMVHPRVKDDFFEWVKKNKNHVYVLKEAALLFETGSFKILDKTIIVAAPVELRIERVLKRDKHRKRKDVLDIMENQLDESDKIEMADFVIINDEKQLVIPQVLAIHEQLMSATISH